MFCARKIIPAYTSYNFTRKHRLDGAFQFFRKTKRKLLPLQDWSCNKLCGKDMTE
jgi:hypothetical protein